MKTRSRRNKSAGTYGQNAINDLEFPAVEVKVEVDQSSLQEDQEQVKEEGDNQPTLLTNMFSLTGSAVLDAVLSEKTVKSKPKSASRPANTVIAASMLQAFKSTKGIKPPKIKKLQNIAVTTIGKTIPKQTVPALRKYTRSSKEKEKSSVKTLTRSATLETPKIVPKTGRVIGRELDIRKQLLTSFTEVVASKSKVGQRQSCPPAPLKEESSEEKIPTSSSSQDVSKIKLEKKSKSLSVAELNLVKFRTAGLRGIKPKPRKFAKQNIASAPPGRKEAGTIKSMLCNAITKVLNCPITSIRTNRLSREAQPLPTKNAVRRRRSKRFGRKTHKRNIDDQVKVELITDGDDDYEYDIHSNTIRLPGPNNLNDMNVEYEEDLDPLALCQSEIPDSNSVGVKMEDDEMETGGLNNHSIFCDLMQSEYDVDQADDDVELKPLIESGTDRNEGAPPHTQTDHDTTDGSNETELLQKTVVKTEIAEPEYIIDGTANEDN